jgi:predicted transcriptional regulator YheO
MSEEVKKLVNICKSFVRSMYRTEEAVSKMDEVLSAEEMREALQQVLAWIQETDEIPENSFTREIAREIIGQLSGILVLKGYQGSADHYIA